MNLDNDALATFEHLLGPDLVALLDELETVDDGLDALPADDVERRARRAELERRHAALRADAGARLVSVRRRLGPTGLPPLPDTWTIPLPFVDLGER